MADELYYANGDIQHDGVTYKHGALVTIGDPEVIKSLRNLGSLKTAGELFPPAALDIQLRDAQARILELEAENQQLRDQLVTGGKSSRKVSISDSATGTTQGA